MASSLQIREVNFHPLLALAAQTSFKKRGEPTDEESIGAARRFLFASCGDPLTHDFDDVKVVPPEKALLTIGSLL